MALQRGQCDAVRMLWFGLCAALVIVAAAALWQRQRTRAHVTLAEDEAATLAAVLPQWPQLTPEQRARLLAQVADFLTHKDFYGCNGLEVTRDMALRIAGMGCLLTLREAGRPYPSLRSVLVYPDAFLVRDPEPDELGIVHDEPEERIGESWDAQRIVLSWPDVEEALAGGPTNVVAHECAHQLDSDGLGRPEGAERHAWAAAMAPAFEALRAGPSPVLDDYGAESPVEFFAVVVESYLQAPEALRDAHPQVYAALLQHFGLRLAQPAVAMDNSRGAGSR